MKKVLVRKNMYIDIGATSEKDVEEAGVRVGDPIVPVSEFSILANPKTYMSKAFDDRVGCGVLITTLNGFVKKGHPNTIYGVTTVQEEVGVRGANTSVEMVNPDVAIIRFRICEYGEFTNGHYRITDAYPGLFNILLRCCADIYIHIFSI